MNGKISVAIISVILIVSVVGASVALYMSDIPKELDIALHSTPVPSSSPVNVCYRQESDPDYIPDLNRTLFNFEISVPSNIQLQSSDFYVTYMKEGLRTSVNSHPLNEESITITSNGDGKFHSGNAHSTAVTYYAEGNYANITLGSIHCIIGDPDNIIDYSLVYNGTVNMYLNRNP